MNIRIAKLDDLEKIIHLEEQIFKLHSEGRPDWIDNNKIGFNTEYYKSIIENPDKGIVFVAEENNNIIGHCIVIIYEIKEHFLMKDMKNINIEDLCIEREYQKKGIGRKLFEEAIKYGRNIKANILELGVWDFNKNAVDFYEHLGMKTRLRKMEYKLQCILDKK
jgi:ribosomal protein S18 acetylase RimI-like enzyme